MSRIIVGLDIGTSTIRAVIGEVSEEGDLLVTGIGKAVSRGLRSGLIVNIEATVDSIKEAVESAEMMAGREVQSCFIAIGGAQIESLLSKGLVAVTDKGRGSREITRNDIDRVIEAAKALNIPLDRKILHVVPRSYQIDGQKGIKAPLNMLGVRLEAEVCIFTSSGTSTQNFLRCTTRAGYNVNGVMLKTLAVAQAVLSEDEKELGSIVIDMGGGTTDVLVLAEGTPLYAGSIPAGGSHVTNDISLVKGISYEAAEKIKLKNGCCWEPLVSEDEEILIPGLAGNPPQVILRKEIAIIIQSRVDEIFDLVREKLPRKVKQQRLHGSVILSGGGALLPGITEMACAKFKTDNVRIAMPQNFGGASDLYRTAEWATVIGLLVENSKKEFSNEKENPVIEKKKKNSFFQSVARWFSEFK